ncbi:MAG TPA: peptidoglycan DD-metalloendopeptidase family protein [Pyrinomonadaceae bacterium]
MPPTNSTGIRNNNFLNVKNGSDPWQDANSQTARTDERGHAVFTDPAYGVRAGIILLRSYFFKHNLRTVAEILARWAPESDTVGSLPNAPQNSPVEYSTFVASRMGISFNQKLDIFKEDKTVGNIARLRALFGAMAEYENGNGFQVPEDVFHAGLELVQPGITDTGEEDAAAEDAAAAESAAASADIAANDAAIVTDTAAVVAETGAVPQDVEDWKISGSVGRWERRAVNRKEDVETVQEMLRGAAMILRDQQLDPGTVDGSIARAGRRSQTIEAIKVFQSRFMTSPDGVIGVGGRTWRELITVLSHGVEGPPEEEEPAPADGDRRFFFPVNPLPRDSWTVAPRCYGSRRAKGARAHAGCDLYAPIGTVVHAITDGTVVRGPVPFYAGTYAIEVDHGDFLARYGEVQGEAFVRKGDNVKAGQPIAKVGRLIGISVPSAMLHLELYDKSAHGPLTVPASQSARDKQGRPFLRRKDLIDPQPKLEQWKSNLPNQG